MINNELEFEQVYVEFKPKIYRYLVRLIGVKEAEDLTQDVFAKVAKAFGTFSNRSQLSTWVYQIIIGKLHLEHLVEDYVYQIKSCEAVFYEPTFRERCQEAREFTVDLLKKISLYVMVALAIGGFIHGYVPEDFLVQYAGRSNPLAVPLVVLIGIPLYSSAAGMVPVVYALMEKGLPLGTSLSFMMAVTALSVPAMIILRKVLKVKLIGILVGILSVAIILTGYLFNLVV